MYDSSIHFWIKEFSDGRARIIDRPRSSRTKSGRSIANVRTVENLVAADRRVTIKDMSVSSGLATSTIQRILKHDLGLTKKCAKFVPADLTDRHKECRRDICNFMMRLMANHPRVFQTVVTMDESWVYVYDPETKLQSKEWLRKGEPRPQKPRRTLATGKIMVVTFFDAKGMVYFEFVQRPLTINQEVYRAIFRRFDATHTLKRPNSLVNGHKFVHMDNAPAHNATLTLDLIRDLGWTRLPQPACSPDLAPNDFWLYPRLKKNL